MIGFLLGGGSSRGRFSQATRAAFRSPESRSVFAGTVGILAACILLWVGWAAVLSLLNAWAVVGLTAALAVAVYVRGRGVRRRQLWINEGFCGQCGYDLHTVPSSVCPECGRDAAVDEPIWRRLRREHEAKYGRDVAADARGEGVQVDDATVRRLLARAQVSELDG